MGQGGRRSAGRSRIEPKFSEVEVAPGREAGVVSGQTCSADVGPDGVDRASCRDADFTGKSAAAIAFASHPAGAVIDKLAGNLIEPGVVFQGEPRPFR